MSFSKTQITLKELENLLVKLQQDRTTKAVNGSCPDREKLCPLLRSEIQAILKFADKDKSGTITYGVIRLDNDIELYHH